MKEVSELAENKKRRAERLNQESDGRDVEFSRELADHEDMEAQARATAADERVEKRHRH